MPKVERLLVAEGECFVVECAVRADLSSPVKTFLEELGEGGSPIAAHRELDEQIDWRYWFVGACESIARDGDPPHPNSFNQLMNGVWEIKHWEFRVSFYDTDGTGAYTPLIDYDSYPGFAQRPWPEDFDEYLRLTTAFRKTGPKTAPGDIALATQVREEDLDHDRTNEEGAPVAG